MCEYGSLRGNWHSKKGPRELQIPSFEKKLLNTIRKNPSTSVRAIDAAVRESESGVHSVLQNEGLCPCHLQRVPSLLLADHPVRVYFAQ